MSNTTTSHQIDPQLPGDPDCADIEEQNRIDSLLSSAELRGSEGRRILVEAVREEGSRSGMAVSVEFNEKLTCILRCPASGQIAIQRSSSLDRIELGIPERVLSPLAQESGLEADGWNHIRISHGSFLAEAQADIEKCLGSPSGLLMRVVIDDEHRFVIVPLRNNDWTSGIGIRLSGSSLEDFEIHIPQGVLNRCPDGA